MNMHIYVYVMHIFYVIYKKLRVKYFSRCNADIYTYFTLILCLKYTYISLFYLYYIWRNKSLLTLSQK